MARNLICSLLCLAMMTPAIAGEHYVEVWNPPEARAHAPSLAKPAPTVKPHKPLKHKRVSLGASHVAPYKVAPARAQASATSAKSALSFDSIPRQITPEGNVLRVSGRRTQEQVQH